MWEEVHSLNAPDVDGLVCGQWLRRVGPTVPGLSRSTGAGPCLMQLCGRRRTWLAAWPGTTVPGMRSSCASSLSTPSKPGSAPCPSDTDWSQGHLRARKLPVRQTCASDQPLHVQIVVLLVWTGFCSTQALLWWEFGWKVSDVCPVNAAAWYACVLQHQLHSSAVKKHPQCFPHAIRCHGRAASSKCMYGQALSRL